jgi:hypothetical protein
MQLHKIRVALSCLPKNNNPRKEDVKKISILGLFFILMIRRGIADYFKVVLQHSFQPKSLNGY